MPCTISNCTCNKNYAVTRRQVSTDILVANFHPLIWLYMLVEYGHCEVSPTLRSITPSRVSYVYPHRQTGRNIYRTLHPQPRPCYVGSSTHSRLVHSFPSSRTCHHLSPSPSVHTHRTQRLCLFRQCEHLLFRQPLVSLRSGNPFRRITTNI